jgi:4-hydroxybenzoate polyprenyltransferase
MIRLILAYILGSAVTMLTYVAYMEATYTGVLLSGSMIGTSIWWVWSAGKSIKDDINQTF